MDEEEIQVSDELVCVFNSAVVGCDGAQWNLYKGPYEKGTTCK